MSDPSLDELIKAANPIDDPRAAALEIDPAAHDLMLAVLDAPDSDPGTSPDSRPGLTDGKRSRPRSRLPRMGIAALVACAIVAALIITGSGSDSTNDVAWGAEQVRFAEASPLLLLEGWNVVYANEENETTGEMSFVLGSSDPEMVSHGDQLRVAELFWRDVSLSRMVRDRSDAASTITTASVLGNTAKVFMYDQASLGMKPTDPPVEQAAALWNQDGQVLELRTQVPDLDSFKERLATLRKVDVDDWLSALPPSSVPTGGTAAVVDEMLRGVPLPPGFDISGIPRINLTKDRLALAQDVSTAVTCSWFANWAKARRQGDTAAVKAAIDAMRSSKDWPVLREAKIGMLISPYVAAMPRGTIYGRPLAPELFAARGCRAKLGITLKDGG